MITLQQAQELTFGAKLSFETDFTYEVTGVEITRNGKGVRLSLLRSDGFDTFATENDLKKARLVKAGEAPAPVADEEIAENLQAAVEQGTLSVPDDAPAEAAPEAEAPAESEAAPVEAEPPAEAAPNRRDKKSKK